MDVLVLIDKLDDTIHNAKPVPLTDQVRVDKEEIYDILDQMRATIPEEIKQARWIVKERQEMLAEAKREAERIVKEARERQTQLVSQQEVTRRAGRPKSADITPAVLELRDLARTYGDVVALDGVSFSVPAGQMFGFVGPNGAGKTTTMRIVLGVLEPDAGEVRWRGRPVDDELRRRIGYMPEERGLYPKMRVRDQLEYFARLHGLSAADAQEATTFWTERLGVAERASDRVEALS